MRYVDAFVLVVPKKKLKEYKTMAINAGKMWKKYGALEYMESVGEDLHPKVMGGMGAMTFPQLTKLKKGEAPVFSYIVYRSRKHRDQVNAKIMKDPMMNDPAKKDMPMPFDMKRMAYGGFEAMVDL